MQNCFCEFAYRRSQAASYSLVTGNLNISFRNLLPLPKVVTVESNVVSAGGRKVMVHGRICLGETIFAEADCFCITLPGQYRPHS